MNRENAPFMRPLFHCLILYVATFACVKATFMVEEGGSPDEIDQIMEDFGFAMGAFKVQDLSG